jgi:3-oxoacyl-[acyl-carrier protein] reductase
MDLGISGRVALITGASKGIGRAIAAELAQEGARLALTARSPERVEAAATELGALGLVHDNADVEGIPDLVRRVEDELGPIDILVCNTGGPPAGPELMLSNAHRASMIAAFKTLAREVAPDGVTLNSVLPGLIATERIAELYGSIEAATEESELPAGRMGTVEEMAAAAAFLCSARASYISGEKLTIDGAMTRSI